jgi:hypothetical protein
MTEWTGYDATTGEALFVLTASAAQAGAVVRPGRGVVMGAYPATAYWFRGAEPVPYTPEQAAAKAARPQPGMRWDNTAMAWIDPRPPEQVQAAAWVDVRTKRDKLLTQCDWVVIRATERGEPVPSAWLSYRQALRDVTQQPDPLAIEWPTIPAGT